MSSRRVGVGGGVGPIDVLERGDVEGHRRGGVAPTVIRPLRLRRPGLAPVDIGHDGVDGVVMSAVAGVAAALDAGEGLVVEAAGLVGMAEAEAVIGTTTTSLAPAASRSSSAVWMWLDIIIAMPTPREVGKMLPRGSIRCLKTLSPCSRKP